MANVLHKITLQYKRSVNTPDYMDGSWIINPDPSVIATVPSKYWKVVGDSLLEMDSGEKSSADGTELPTLKVARKSFISNTIKGVIETNFTPEKQRTLFHLMQEAKADGLTNRLAYLIPFWTWMKQGITLNHNKDNAIDAATTAEEVAAVTLNMAAINSSIPLINVRGALAILD